MNPFIDTALFRNRDFTRATLTMAPFSTAFDGFLLSLVLWEESVWHWPALKIGDRAGSFHGSRDVAVIRRAVDRRFRRRDRRRGRTDRLRRRRRCMGGAGGATSGSGVRDPLRDSVWHWGWAHSPDFDGARHVRASGVVVRHRIGGNRKRPVSHAVALARELLVRRSGGVTLIQAPAHALQIPRQQLVHASDRMVGDTGEDFAQIVLRIEPVQFCRFGQGEDRRGALPAGVRSRE